jgi:hypothetical protein
VPIFDAEDDKGFVFTNSGRGPLGDWSKCKKQLDRKMTALLRQQDLNALLETWQHHDLRRTARTLLSRAAVVTGKCRRQRTPSEANPVVR